MKKSIIVIRNLKEYVESELNDSDYINSVVVYCRVSTKNQIEGSSLDYQQKNGIEFYKTLKSEIKYDRIIVFREEGKSGDDYNKEDLVLRSLLGLVLDKIDNGYLKYFWVLDQSRLSRSSDLTSIILKKFKQNKVNFYESGVRRNLDDLTDSMFMKILGVFDEYENTKRFQKSVWGKIESLRKNKWIGGTYPFGYKKGKTNGEILIDRSKSKYVVKMFEMVRDGKTTKEIVSFLNKNNISSPKTNSGIWNCQTIRNIVRSEKYIGKHIVEQKLDKHLSKEECKEKGLTVVVQQSIPKIINDELFNEVKLVVDNWNSNKISKRNLKYDYLINDITYCGHCGNKMKIKQNSNHNWKVYHCDYSSKQWKFDDDRYTKCGIGISKYINLYKTEELIWNEVLKTFKDSDTIKTEFKNSVLPKKIEERNVPNEKIIDYEKNIRKYTKQIKEIKKRKISLKIDYDLYEISKEEFKNMELRYDDKVLEFEDKISEKSKSILEIKKGIEWYDWLIDFEKHYDEIKNYNTFKERKNFINKHINKVVIKWNKTNNTHKIIIHFNLRIVGDDRIKKDKYVYELINGNCEKVISNFSHLSTLNSVKNFLQPKIVSKTTQQ